MDKDLKLILKTYKKEFNITPRCTDITEILGLESLDLQPYIWNPYTQKGEQFLKDKLKEYLLTLQKQKYNHIYTDCVFQEYKNSYILITYIKESKTKTYTHIIITIYDGNTNYYKVLKRKLTRCHSKITPYSARYTKFKLVQHAICDKFSAKFKEMGLFNKKSDIYQTIYTQRFLPYVYLINNNPKLTVDIESHHIFYDTSIEECSSSSLLPVRADKHTQEFHPENIFGSATSNYNIAKGLMYSQMLKQKYFKVKQKKYNPDIQENLYDILEYYFVQKKSISDIQRFIQQNKPEHKLVYNTINKIVEHFKQYTIVLTKENIETMKNL